MPQLRRDIRGASQPPAVDACPTTLAAALRDWESQPRPAKGKSEEEQFPGDDDFDADYGGRSAIWRLTVAP